MDKKQKSETKKKELRCPFDRTLACEDCRLYVKVSNSVERTCAIIFTALRSF